MRVGGEIGGRVHRGPVVLVAALLAVVTAGLIAGGAIPEHRVAAPVRVDIVWLTALFAVADYLVLSLQDRWQVSSVSLAQLPLVVGLYFVAPPGLLLARVAGISFALLAQRRLTRPTTPIRILEVLAGTAVAIALFRALFGDGSAIAVGGWLAAGAGVLAADAIGAVNRRFCARVDDRRASNASWWSAALGITASLAGTSLALIAVVLAWRDPAAALLLVIVAIVMFLAYRGYSSLRRRYQGLALVAGFTGRVARSHEVDSVVDVVLREARTATGAARAEVVLLGRRSGEGLLRVVSDDTGAEVMTTAAVDPADLVWALAVARDEAFLLTPPNDRSRLGAHLGERGIRNGIVAPLHGDEGISGMLLVANRPVGLRPFDEEDVGLLETLAGHASLSLENGRLIDALRQEAAEKEHESLHDPLTGLANRVQLVSDIEGALAQRREPALVGVMLLDLDGFKEVNDAYGHEDGDDALREVAARLRSAVQPDDVIARLGGDEFAVLLRAVSDESAALDRAWVIHSAICAPMRIGGRPATVGVSIGISLAPVHAEHPTVLLRHADAAMYVAKTARLGCEMFTHADGASARLSRDLRGAVEADELVVHYQPKADLHTGAITGVEALVRWEHPDRGMIGPDAFLPAAEHAGIMFSITMHVLEETLRQRDRWREAGYPLDVAVNLSARDLTDRRLLAEIRRLIDAWDVPAGALTLEITESEVMGDAARVAEALEKISGLGVRLSIDDFGTGYSSVPSLQRLRIDEIKIDRSFVSRMASDRRDAVVVRSTTELARNLGLRVVAEGVEDAASWAELARLGCDTGQGYFLGHPIAGDALLQWLVEHPASPPLLSTAPFARD